MNSKPIMRPTEPVHINKESVILSFRKLVKRISDEREMMTDEDVCQLVEKVVKEEGLNPMTVMFVMGGHWVVKDFVENSGMLVTQDELKERQRKEENFVALHVNLDKMPELRRETFTA
jgi:hypothetical protein